MPLAQVKLGELGGWLARRNKSPQALTAGLSRAWWRWQHKFVQPRRVTLAPFFQLVAASSFVFYIFNYHRISEFFFIVLTICCCCCVLTVELSKMSCNTKNDFFRLTPICRPSHQRQIPLNSAYRVESLLLPVVHCSSSLNFSRSRRPAILLCRVELAIQQHQQAGWQHQHTSGISENPTITTHFWMLSCIGWAMITTHTPQESHIQFSLWKLKKNIIKLFADRRRIN